MTADILVINKFGLVTNVILTNIKDIVRSLNSYSSFILSKDGSLDKMNLITENSNTRSNQHL